MSSRCRDRRVPAGLVWIVPGLLPALAFLLPHLTPLPDCWTRSLLDHPRPTMVDVRDRDGNVLASIRSGDPFVPAHLDRIDPVLIRATLAAEDRRFRLHPGIDPAALLRALVQNVRSGRRVSGGSTLTQQLVKLLEQDPASPGEGRPKRDGSAFGRKIRQSWWALVLEAHLSKNALLEAYLDRAPYGPTERGVGAACRIYFGHDPDRLTVEEAALLAALPQSPVRLDPRRNPEAARRARNRVLARMGLPAAERAEARARPLGLCPAPPPLAASVAPHWIDHVRQELPEAAEITLPLDPDLQRAALAALRRALQRLGPSGADAGAVIAIHNPTGEVRAWVGSPQWSDPDHGQFDAAVALRQPGSALKPFAYAAAFSGGLRPSSLLPDLPATYPGIEGSFRPRNYSGAYHGPVRARPALANSWNAPAVALLSRIGPPALLGLLREAGITSLTRPVEEYGLGLVLGVGEVSLFELTGAYSCLARQGLRIPTVEILEARDPEGRRIDLASSAAPPVRILDPLSAWWVSSILSDSRARAPAFGLEGPFDFPFPVAIKTGTSSDWRDNWAFGYTRTWTVGVWVGQAAGDAMDRVSGTHGAILALREILLHLYPPGSPQEEEAGFPPPGAVVERTICALSGMEAGPDCPDRVTEWFPASDPPGPRCTWHRRVAIDTATGLPAGPSAPPRQVRRVLFTVPLPPPGAGGASFDLWARDQGWPPLPPAPDRVQEAPPGDPQCRITHPVDGSVYAIDPSLPAGQQEVSLEGACDDEGTLRWDVDGNRIGETRPGERIFWPLVAGRHRVRARWSPGARDPMKEPCGREAVVTIEVESGEAPDRGPAGPGG